MDTLLVALGVLAAYLVAYHTYGRWLARRVFRLDPRATCPSHELRDGVDYVPTRRSVVLGHHFTSIAGTGPIVGPAIAVLWGWLPALLWVVFGSIFIGAVHDFGALVVSLRSRGQTIGDAAARMINPRARVLFLVVLFLALAVVLGIFGLVIATIFAYYPGSVFPIWTQIPIAVAVGVYTYRRGTGLTWAALLALVVMVVTVWIGAYWLPLDPGALNVPLHGVAATAAGLPSWANAVVGWTLLLLGYCFIASVLPVWTLLQPRDFINSNLLLITLALLLLGLLLAPLVGAPLNFVAPAVRTLPPEFGAPPIWPFLFITIACGAVSGFHCLVASGTTSKQVSCESHAQPIGYGAMLIEGGLATLVILACCAGLGRGVYTFDAASGAYVARLGEDQAPLVGAAAWASNYDAETWSAFTLRRQIGGFVEGGANMLATLGIPITFGINLIAVLVAAFAATTLDTATRLQRYVISELGAALGVPALRGKYLATSVAVLTGGAIALVSGPLGPGSGGFLLWPIFGATNQMLAGLSFVVIAFYLLRHERPVWFLAAPLALMLVLPNWAMALNMQEWWSHPDGPRWLLLAMGLVMTVLEVWMVIEAALLLRRVRGVAPAPLPALR